MSDQLIPCRFTARAEAVADSHVLARYDGLKMSEDADAENLKEWFPTQGCSSKKPPRLAVKSEFVVHTNPGYHARPAPPSQVGPEALPNSIGEYKAINLNE